MKTAQSCVEKTHLEVTELLQKLARGGKGDESKYVELDVDTGGAQPEKDCHFDERNPMSVLIDNSSCGALRAKELTNEMAIKSKIEANQKKEDSRNENFCSQDVKADSFDPTSPSDLICPKAKTEDCLKTGEKGERVITQQEGSNNNEEDNKNTTTDEELFLNDNYLCGRSESDDWESDDGVSLVLSHFCVPCVTEEDESHYITTHEIQLSELSDHDEGDGGGVGSSASWEMEDDNRVFSFVDYASLDSGEGAAEGERGARRQQQPLPRGAARVSTLLESDPCDAAKFTNTTTTSSDESVSKPQQQQHQCSGNSAGQIHLSIRTTSRAINDPGSTREQGNILCHARRSGDTYVLRGVDSHNKAETLYDRAKCFIAAPGRLHFGRKLRGKEVTGYSSGESSAVSELDDADKEVRNLTAKSFKSLAYPYLDAINFSTSSESSASEHAGKGVNSWSTFVDLKYGNMDMSRGLDQSVVSHKNSTASFAIAKNIDKRGYKGVALASIKPPTSKMFTLNANPHSSASASTKKIELMGNFRQVHGGMIRLTETLNFRCNVNSGMSEEAERRTHNFARNVAVGSRSTDEVTDTLPGGQRRGASKPPSNAMEDAHKKAVFASSLLKNVISKKMQFEQELKMERGEIRESRKAPSPCFTHQEDDGYAGKEGREMQRKNSMFSESSSDYTIMCMDDLEDIMDSGSSDTMSDTRRQDTLDAPETNLESANEAGIDTKKGTLEASKGTLLRSQNSAFRCWKDEELEFQKDHKNNKTAGEKSSSANKDCEGDQYSSDSDKLTKMSHLFVPSIQLLPSDGEVGQQLQSGNYSPCGNGGGLFLRSDNTLYIADTGRVTTSKSPAIKINLRSVRDDKSEHFGVSKLRAPNIGSNASSLARTDDFTCQALAAALKGESSDKVPQFMVRDIRDNKGKLQTPIHQVRDVRKMVKSSYHFVSLDKNETKSNFASADSHSEQNKQMSYQNPNSVSPIVIKCQSVNINSNGKQSENLFDLSKPEPFDVDRSSPEGAKSAPLQKAAVRAPIDNSNGSSEGGVGLRMEGKQISDIIDKKPESKMGNQGALQKLQAAVKTMEQLYVFERNEWKRKAKSQPLTDSHVLSLIAREELGGPEEEEVTVRRDSYPNTAKTPPAVQASHGMDSLLKQDNTVFQNPSSRESMQATTSTGCKNMFNLSSSFKAYTQAKTPPQTNNTTQTPFSTKGFVPKSPKYPVSLKVSQKKQGGHEVAESREVQRSMQEPLSATADNENYLTIPVKSYASSEKQASAADKTPLYAFNTQQQQTTPPGHLGFGARSQEEHNQAPRRSSNVMETCSPEIPPATIYHSLPMGMSPNQPQVYCFSPAITPAPAMEPFQATQRKMLLDPTTGNYYLVDTPVQPATRRLFDPETGQYVDVPMPQPPMTPVPMPMSPLALNPGAYGHTYMVYPGYMPTSSMIPARTLVQSQMSMQSEAESAERALLQQAEGMYMESPYYMATGKSPQVAYGAQQQANANRPPPQGFSSVKQPVISISSQQGPRIIAPPSFDGTTMSFVVEHR